MSDDFRYLSTFSMEEHPPCGVALMRSDKLTDLHKSMGYFSANMEMCLPALLSIFKHMQADWEDGRSLYPALVPIRSHLGNIIKELESIENCITEWHKQLGDPKYRQEPLPTPEPPRTEREQTYHGHKAHAEVQERAQKMAEEVTRTEQP